MATQIEVAEHLDLSDTRVRDLVSVGVLPRAERRGELDLAACRVAYIRHLRGRASGHQSASGELDLIEERARLAKEQADSQALKNATLRGELIPMADVEAGMIVLASSVAQRLSALPTKVAPLAHAAATIADAEAIIRQHIDEARSDLANEGERLQAAGLQLPESEGLCESES